MIGRMVMLAAVLALPACSKNTPNEVQANTMGPGMMANGDVNAMMGNGMMGNGMMSNGMMGNRPATSSMPVPGTNPAEHIVHHDNGVTNKD